MKFPDRSEHALKRGSAPRPESSRLETFLALVCIALIAVVAAVTAGDYGITWDWVPDLYIAERNLNSLTSGELGWLDFSVPVDLSMHGRHLDLTRADAAQPWRSFYFGPFLSSVGCKIFFQELEWVDSVTAHQLPNLLLLAGALAAVYFFVRRSWGYPAALASLAAVAFQPRLWAHLQFNLKDFPYAALMAITLLSARRAILDRSWGMTVVSAALLGVTACTKPNAALILVLLALWVPFAHRLDRPAGRERSFRAALLAAPFVAAATYVAVWPYLWVDPVGKLAMHFGYYVGHAAGGPDHFQWDRLLRFLSVQPVGLLVFGATGVGLAARGAWKDQRREEHVLLLLWLLLPVLRVALPRATDYDGVRHYIEYAVPLGILGGIGFIAWTRWLWQAAEVRLRRAAAIPIVVVLVCLLPAHWAYRFVQIHPFQLLHYNVLVGGASGAAQRWSDATDYWGSSYRQGSDWLREHAESGALVSVPVANHVVFATRRLWLRDDLVFLRMPMMSDAFVPDSRARLAAYAEQPDRPVYVMYVTRSNWYGPLVRMLEQPGVEPIHEIVVDGVSILKIHRLDPAAELTRRWIEGALGASRTMPR